MKRIAAITICILILTLSFTACSNHPSIYADKDDSPLTIYIPDNNEFIKYHIDKYNDAHETTQIEYDVIDKNYYNVMYERIERDELREGKGPDLVFVDKTFMERRDFIRMAKDGIFADMDKLIERSQSFDPELYNMDVLDTGIIDDTRVFIPLTYRLDVAVASPNSFKKIDEEAPTELTLERFLYSLDSFYKDSERRVIPPMLGIDPRSILHAQINEDNCIDKSPEIDKLIEYVIKIRYRDGVRIMKQYNVEWYDIYFGGNLYTTVNGGEDFFSSLYYQYNVFKNKYDSDMIYYNHPLTAQKPSSYFDQGFAISANSEKKNKAFKFIEYMLSEEVQSGNLYAPTIPIRKDSYKLAKEKLLNNDYDLFNDADFSPTPVPTDLANQFINMVENTKCEFSNHYYITNRCIGSALIKHLQGEVELEDLVFQFNGNLNTYYNNAKED